MKAIDTKLARSAIPARQRAGLLSRKQTDLEPEPIQTLIGILRTSKECRIGYRLAQSFTAMLRDRQPGWLNGWLHSARESAPPEIRPFAQGSRQAFYAALFVSFVFLW